METKTSFDQYIPTHIVFGRGKLNTLHQQTMPGRKALLVISNGKSTKVNGYLARTIDQLIKAGVEHVLFDKIEANPLRSTVMDGAQLARLNGCDFIVALGGGSVMDASKGIATAATNEGDLWDYIFFGSGKAKPINNRPLPIIAITTTAGTGSEADSGAVITHETLREKTALLHPALFPVLSIVDAELTVSVPPQFTAFQGFDALFHSTEAYISTGTNLLSDMYALTAIENVARNLAQAVKDGTDIEARERVLFGNTPSGFVMCVGACTSEHSLEHAMSAYHQELPHGAGLIMISKAYYSHFIEQGVAPERFVRMAQAMGMENATKPEDFITMLTRLQEACGVAQLKMSDYGISPEEFQQFTTNAKETMGFLFTCDRKELSDADCIKIYSESYK